MRYRYPRIPESEVTPRALFESRRRFLRHGAALGMAAALPGLAWSPSASARRDGLQASLAADLPSVSLANGEPLTSLRDITTYNNFYEFGTGKRDPETFAHRLVTDPWSLTIEGEVDKAGTFALEDVLKHQDLEERIYRLRCVEAWSKVVPWIGFPLAALLKRHEPTSRARYVVFESIHDPDNLRGQRRSIIEWPYREALRIDEAMHPSRCWPSASTAKSCPTRAVRRSAWWCRGNTASRASSRSCASPWWRNAPRLRGWRRTPPSMASMPTSIRRLTIHAGLQARERRIGESGRRETLMFNGYGEQVASLYAGMDLSEHY